MSCILSRGGSLQELSNPFSQMPNAAVTPFCHLFNNSPRSNLLTTVHCTRLDHWNGAGWKLMKFVWRPKRANARHHHVQHRGCLAGQGHWNGAVATGNLGIAWHLTVSCMHHGETGMPRAESLVGLRTVQRLNQGAKVIVSSTWLSSKPSTRVGSSMSKSKRFSAFVLPSRLIYGTSPEETSWQKWEISWN